MLSCLPLVFIGARLMFVSTRAGVLLEIWKKICAFTCTTHLVVDQVFCPPKLCQSCVLVFFSRMASWRKDVL